MKYIKEYIDVNFFDEGYFTEITLSEYDKLMYTRRKLSNNDRTFRPTSRENIWLDKLDKWGDYSFCIEGGEMMSFFMVNDNLNEISGGIYKLADEWFVVEVSLHKRSHIKNIYYKCDQVDGLINLFKSLKPSIWKSNLSINEDFYYLYGSEDGIVKSRNIISMRDVSINYFKKVFDDVIVDRYFDFDNKIMNNVEFVFISKRYGGNTVAVYEYEDEWFKVVYAAHPSAIDNRMYWCDQLEGVVRCINEKF